MAARCKGRLTHRVKERMRHRNFNRLLNKVYHHVPGCKSKAKKAYKIKMITSYILYLRRVREMLTQLNKQQRNGDSETLGSLLTASGIKVEETTESKMEDESSSSPETVGKLLLQKVRNSFIQATMYADKTSKKSFKQEKNCNIEEILTNNTGIKLPLSVSMKQTPEVKFFNNRIKLNIISGSSIIDISPPDNDSSCHFSKFNFHGLRL